MRNVDSLRGQITVLLLSMFALVAVVAGSGAGAVQLLRDDVEVLVDDLRPAAYANIDLRNHMDRALADARGWALTKDETFADAYQVSVDGARVELRALEAATAGDAELRRLAGKQAAAVTGWIRYVDGRLAREPGQPPRELLAGEYKYDGFLQVNENLSDAIDGRMDRRGEETRDRARDFIAFVTLVSLVGLGLTALLGWRMVRRASGRLREIEDDVARLAAGDLGARASVDGHREIRAVAAALNTLAEENQRAREMEERVVTQLRRLDRAKDEFVSTVSHELRTPLTSIAGYVELFEDGFGDDLTPQQQAMLGVVGRNVRRLRALIEDLLTLSRVEADAFRTSFDLVDLNRLAADAARDITQTAARASVVVGVSTPDEPLVARGDVGQLARATLNLLSNAVKFSPPGSEVLVRVAPRDGQGVVAVEDNGIGIPAEELPTLGTRFFRASNAVESEITGTGLGLRIVQTIADNHGGRLELDSQEGRGTTARLVVPLAEAQEQGNIHPLQEITEG